MSPQHGLYLVEQTEYGARCQPREVGQAGRAGEQRLARHPQHRPHLIADGTVAALEEEEHEVGQQEQTKIDILLHDLTQGEQQHCTIVA